MVAYSFKPSFARLIEAGRKHQTVRNHRKRHARPGEPVQLYTGMRTKQCRKLVDPDPVCTRVDDIRMMITKDSKHATLGIEINGVPLSRAEQTVFTMADGFSRPPVGMSPLDYMGRWWAHTHGEGVFVGVVIHWERQG